MSVPPAKLPGILNPVHLRKLSRSWILEDQPAFDMQALACDCDFAEAVITCKTDSAILAGVPFVEAVARELSVDVEWLCHEGSLMPPRVAVLRGRASDVLKMERVALNVLARCCGIASVARRVRTKLDSLGWSGMLAGTRKTTPGFRLAEKYSLLVGGASQHRHDLSHMIMIKDNHVALSGGDVRAAVSRVRSACDFASKIEVECSCLEEAQAAVAAGADIVMLDNMEPEEAKRVARQLKTASGGGTTVEVSGGINENNVEQYCDPAIDVLSMGCLVQGSSSVDFSLRISSPAAAAAGGGGGEQEAKSPSIV